MCRQIQKVVKRLCGVLLLLGGAAGALALEDLLTILVELELGDDDLGGSDGDGDGLAVGLLADNCVVWLAAVVWLDRSSGYVLPLTWITYLRR